MIEKQRIVGDKVEYLLAWHDREVARRKRLKKFEAMFGALLIGLLVGMFLVATMMYIEHGSMIFQ